MNEEIAKEYITLISNLFGSFSDLKQGFNRIITYAKSYN